MKKIKNHRMRLAPPLIPIIAVMIALMTLLAVSVSAADESAAKNEITSIKLNKSKSDIQIDVSLTTDYFNENKSATLYVFELAPYQSASALDALEPVADFKAAETASVKIPYINGNTNRLYSKFLIAERRGDGSYGVITSAKYIENLTILAENTGEYPATSSKKGLQIQMFSDAQQLGVQHATINIPLNEYILGENSSGALSFVFGGQTYYLDKDKIALLDHRVKVYSDAGINVYFNIVLTPPTDGMNATLKSFYFDGVSTEASLCALNTKNETAMKNFVAFMDYLASRYTREDHAYGFAPNFIVGFEVNSNRTWNSAGPIEMSNYIYSYCTAFRAAYTAMKSHFANGRVYISLGNNFTSMASEPGAAADPLYDYAAKDFLDFFNTTIKTSGDIPWGLAVNPYPSDVTTTEFWLDSYAEDNLSTPFITMKNIAVLTRYMNQSEMMYGSEVRSVIISEFGVSGDPNDQNSMSLQAAAYALAYYTAAQDKDIDAFIWHRHVDHSGENAWYGLWTSREDSTLEASAKKPIYNVFSQIDTDKSEEATAFVKNLVGSGAFSLFMPDGIQYSTFSKRTIIEAIRAEENDYAKGYSEKTLYDLTKGSLDGFYPSDSADYVELSQSDDNGGKTMLYARVTGTPLEYMGISNLITDKDALKNAQFISLRLKVTAPEGVSMIDTMLRLQKNGSDTEKQTVFEGAVSLKPNEWQTVSFRIKDFMSLTGNDIDLMKLWIKTPDSASPAGEYGLWLSEVVIRAKGGTSVIGVILIILLILVLLAVGGYAGLWFRAQRIRRRRREAMERKRREQLRRQAMQNNRMNPPPYSQNPNRPPYPPRNNPPQNNNPYNNNQR